MKRTVAPQAPGQRGPSLVPKKPPSDVSNGTATAPLTYPVAEPADDVNMNEVVMVDEKVTLSVFLPSGTSTSVTVDSNIPMLDLLVHVAGRCRVSPAAHELQVLDEETGKALEFKPNQTVGSLGLGGDISVHLLAKNRRPEWSQAAKASSKAAMAFEITQRFTINLPGGQKAVMRVSPQLTLGQVLAKVCQDKSLDTARYTLQHPSHPRAPLSLTHTIADSKLSEINLVHADNRTGSAAAVPSQRPSSTRPTSMAPSASSSSSSSASATASHDPSSWYMPGIGETKKKKGFLSFLSKKEKKFKLDSHHTMETSSIASGGSHRSTSALPPGPRSTTPPPPSDFSRAPSRAEGKALRPHTMYVTSTSSSSRDSSPRGQRAGGGPTAGAKNSPQEQRVAAAAAGGGGSKERLAAGEPKASPRGAGGGKKRPAPPPPQVEAATTKAAARTAVAAAAAPSAKSSNIHTSKEEEKGMVKATSAAPVAAAASASASGSARSRQSTAPTLTPANAEVTSGLDTKQKTSSSAATAATTVAADVRRAAGEVSVVVESVPGTTSVSSRPQAEAAGGRGGEGSAEADASSVATSSATSNAATSNSLLHSRNSSDSSGYHELTFSGAESPEASHHHLPTTFKTSIDTTSIDSGDNLGNGDSGIQDISSPEEQQQQQQQQQQGSGRGDLSKPSGVGVGNGGDLSRTLSSSTSTKKKKKAPPPPPKAIPAPVQEETSEVTVDETDHPYVDRPGSPALEAEEEEEEEGSPSPSSIPTEKLATSEEPATAPPGANVEEEAPASMKLNLDFLGESEDDTETERTDDEEISGRRAAPSEAATAATTTAATAAEEASGALTATSATNSESKEAFDLDDILNSVVFDEEPLRTSTTHTPRTADDDNDDDDVEDSRGLAMMETASIVSEEVEVEAGVVVVVDDVRSRPCEFIAPPPPVEPPPEDYSPRGSSPLRSYADKSTVVGEDNVSLAPASLKGSPVSKTRTFSDDLPSDATVPSPRDLGHVTEPATPLPPLPDWLLKEDRSDPQPQEAASSLHGHSEEEETLPAMGSASAFAMTEEISAPLETVPPPLQFQTVPPPLQFQTEEDDKEEEEEVVTVTEEYIIPLAPGGGLDFSAAVKVSEDEGKEKRSSGARTEPISISSRDASSSWMYDFGGERRGDEASLGNVKQRGVQSGVSVVQQDFVGSTKMREESATRVIRAEENQKDFVGSVKKREESATSFIRAEENQKDFVGSVKKREESATSFNRAEEKQKDFSKQRETESITTTTMTTTSVAPHHFVGSAKKREEPAASIIRAEERQRNAAVQGAPKQQKPAAEKEEFVLTLEDLSSVSLVPLRPKKYTAPRVTSAPVPVKEKQEEDEVANEGSGSPQRRHLHLAYVSDHGHVQPARPYSSYSSTTHTPSFASHPAKESSSSPRASSPAASPRQEPEPTKREENSGSGSEHRYRATAKLSVMPDASPLPVLQDAGGRETQARSRTPTERRSGGGDSSPQVPQGGESSAADLQRQYSSMQQQLSVWQQQLQQNQTVLSGQGGGGGGGAANSEDTLRTLQMQMQMQQQMMEQLQRSMQALALQPQQQQSASSTGPASGRGASPSRQPPPPSSGVQVTVNPPPAPPAAPAPAKVVVRAPTKKVTTQPLSSRLQPQLDPREELMIAIRSFGGISGLNTVAVSDTRWASDKN